MKWSDVKWYAKQENEVCNEMISMMWNKGLRISNLLIFTRIIARICQVLLLLLRCTYAQYEESQHGMMSSTSSIALTYALRGTGNCPHRTKSEIIGAASFRADAAHPLASQSSVCFEKRGEISSKNRESSSKCQTGALFYRRFRNCGGLRAPRRPKPKIL